MTPPADPIGRYLAAVAQQARAWAGSCKKSDVCGGRVGIDEITSLARSAPAALSACLSVAPAAARDRPQGRSSIAPATCTIGVYCVAIAAARDAQCRAMATGVAAGAAAADWTALLRAEIEGPRGRIPADAGAACDADAVAVSAQNLFDGKLDNLGVALWVVSWRIGIRLPVPGAGPAPAVTVPSRLLAGWTPDIGPDRLRDYKELS